MRPTEYSIQITYLSDPSMSGQYIVFHSAAWDNNQNATNQSRYASGWIAIGNSRWRFEDKIPSIACKVLQIDLSL